MGSKPKSKIDFTHLESNHYSACCLTNKLCHSFLSFLSCLVGESSLDFFLHSTLKKYKFLQKSKMKELILGKQRKCKKKIDQSYYEVAFFFSYIAISDIFGHPNYKFPWRIQIQHLRMWIPSTANWILPWSISVMFLCGPVGFQAAQNDVRGHNEGNCNRFTK